MPFENFTMRMDGGLEKPPSVLMPTLLCPAAVKQANHLAVPRFFGQHFRVFGDSIHGFLGTQSTRICSSFETAVLKRGFAIARENRRKRGAAHVATHV